MSTLNYPPDLKELSESPNPSNVENLYQTWFLDYASYVILERAVPKIEDGLKPVQRRILHALKEIDDGRFNKVANVIGSTMQYHPHGDAAIYEAVVNLGQKNLLLETQGNWGDINTGDKAAAARYIEVRLSKFAHAVLYNPQTTVWQLSYDGRKKEPLSFPSKFPVLLVQGAEGIAVGLSTKIVPHNFCEVAKASIKYLKNKPFNILPDFPTGGIADCSNYKGGVKGSKIRVRAKIKIVSPKIITIEEIPFGTTTEQLIQSILKANDLGKIKIKKISNNTAEHVSIEIDLVPGQKPETLINALYAFTNCEHSISPNNCIIINNKPHFLSIDEILKICTEQTKTLLQKELLIQKNNLLENLFFTSLEQIFIEKKIYRRIENALSWEEVLTLIERGLKPHVKNLYREVTRDDITKLTEIKIKRISKYDSFKADTLVKELETKLDETNHHLNHLIQFTINFYTKILKNFGKLHPRKTVLETFSNIIAQEVVANNTKLFFNKKSGFIGYGLKKEEFVKNCSDIDEVLVFIKKGIFIVVLIGEKVFVDRDILHIDIFNRNKSDKIYNLIYLDGETGHSRVKKFEIQGIIRDKRYMISTEHPKSKILYLQVQEQDAPAPVVDILLSESCTARNKSIIYDFKNLDLKGRGIKGNLLTKYPIKRIKNISKKQIQQIKTTLV